MVYAAPKSKFFSPLTALFFPDVTGYDLYVRTAEAHQAWREVEGREPTLDGFWDFLFWANVENGIFLDVAAWIFNTVHNTAFSPKGGAI